MATRIKAGPRFVFAAIGQSPLWMRLTLAAAILGLVALIAASLYLSQGKVVPGVTVIGAPIGGLTRDEAELAIRTRVAEFERQRVTIEYGAHAWQPTLAELGVAVDVDAVIADATGVGRGLETLSGVLRILHLRSDPVEIDPALLIDRSRLETYCLELMMELEMAPVSSGIQVSGGSVILTPDRAGQVVNADRLHADLIRELTGFTWPTIDLDVRTMPASIRADDLQFGLGQVSTALAEPLVLFTAEEQWTIAPEELARHVTLDDTNGDPTISFAGDAIAAIVDQVADQIDRPAQETEVDESGPYPRLRTPLDGRTVDRAQLEVRIHQAISLGTHEVEIPITVMSAGGDETALLAEYGIVDALATGTSDFSGASTGRAANVRRAAELLDGTLIPPGAELSFNAALGEITEDNDFVAAGMTEAGIPGEQPGGGICQLATSLFRAAVYAGLPFGEWWTHPYRNVIYERGGWAPGLDAMVVPGELDLRFTNITADWMLIRVAVSPTSELEVTLHGTDPGFAVEIGDPVYAGIVPSDGVALEEVDTSMTPGASELWQPARDGVTMSTHRTVWQPDGTLISDGDFVATYRPQGPVYRVGPDTGSMAAGDG